ncbi:MULTISPECIES: hypothetical protein [unclassified Haladaptatus]|uniref:hypothetical protein n=1 Tax=unclassified Haladaptatus TaxID=2622732 RepID=UPI0023E84082|nr:MULTISPECIES: hypothetical protein [unclassified Haladaptatus]
MSIWVTVAQGATALNVLLLAGLGYVWGRNYLKFRSKHTIGLFMFSVFLLAQNALTLYYYLIDPDLSAWYASAVPTIVWQSMMLLAVLQFVGLLFLSWTAWD